MRWHGLCALDVQFLCGFLNRYIIVADCTHTIVQQPSEQHIYYTVMCVDL